MQKENKYEFVVEHYKGNRIVLKIMRLLERDGVYEVKRFNDKCIFVLRISSNLSEDDSFKKLVYEIISYIADHFPKNYLFDFSGCPLGFVYSFSIRGPGNDLKIYHRIKEINKNSIIPENQINI